MSRDLQRWVAQLEARRRPAEERVRYIWWDRRGPMPEAMPGERLVVISWAEEEPLSVPGR
jgi:hypothetical protein